MKTWNHPKGLLLIMLCLFAAPAVHAQFPGDVFFKVPSIAINEGGEGILEIQVFAGDDVFGAAQFSLVYAPDQLEVLVAEPGSSAAVRNGFTITESEGRVSIIALNSASLTQPIGTVSVARLEVRPLVAAGSRIAIGTIVNQVLRQDSSAFPTPNGFGGEIVVTNPNAMIADTASVQQGEITPLPGDPLYQRAVAVRPAGATVTLMMLDARNGASTARIRTTTPGVVSD